jgi:hypothetical protein
MRIDQPRPFIAGILCLILWISFIISPSVTNVVPSILFLFLCGLNRKMLRAMKKLIRAVIFAIVLLSIVTFARILGGADSYPVIEHSLRALGVLSTLVITIVILSSSVSPLDWLGFFETVHLPRDFIYVLLATGTSLSIISDHGKKSVSLLMLKGYKMNTLFSKFGAYTRIVMPTFSVLFQDMTVHAQSLYYRGFLEKQRYKLEYKSPSRRNQWIWIISAILTILIGLALRIWI